MADGPDEGGFGDRLRRLRLTAGLTQEDLAERAALSVRGISDLERGARTAPQRETVRLLADALGLTGADRGTFFAAARRRPDRAGDEPTGDPGPRWLGRARPTRMVSSLVGRGNEIELASSILRRDDVRFLTLSGPGGVGKTSLAVAVARTMAAEFPDGVAFFDLAALDESRLLGSFIAATLGLSETGGESPDDSICAALKGHRTLLILDNVEHLSGAAKWISDFLDVCPGPVVVATSRVRLRTAAAWDYPIAPLPLPSDGNDVMEAVAASAAARLFIARAREVRPGIELTTDNAATVAAICRRLDGLPLALELAAARTRVLALPALQERLSNAMPVLTRGAADAPGRQQTLRGAIAWSYDLLTPAEQHLLACLSVFAGNFSFDAIEAVYFSGPNDSILDVLEALLDAHLLTEVVLGDEPRFRLLETIREFARERLNAFVPEGTRVRARHADYYADLAKQASLHVRGGEQVEWFERLDVEHDNLRAALTWFEEALATDEGSQLCAALTPFWMVRGHLTEGRDRFERMLRLAGGDEKLRARALNNLGSVANEQNDHTRAESCYEESLAIFRKLGDQPAIAAVVNNLGRLATWRGEYARARELFSESKTVVEELGDPARIGMSYYNLGLVALDVGDLETANAHLEHALSIRRLLQDANGVAYVLKVLSVVDMQSGDKDVAHERCLDAERIFREVGNQAGLAGALSRHAELQIDEGNLDEAVERLRESLRIQLEIMPRPEPRTLEIVARLAARRGHLARSVRLIGAAARVRDSIGEPLPPLYRASHETTIDQLRTGLGADKFDRQWEAGRTLLDHYAIEDALAEVQGAPG